MSALASLSLLLSGRSTYLVKVGTVEVHDVTGRHQRCKSEKSRWDWDTEPHFCVESGKWEMYSLERIMGCATLSMKRCLGGVAAGSFSDLHPPRHKIHRSTFHPATVVTHHPGTRFSFFFRLSFLQEHQRQIAKPFELESILVTGLSLKEKKRLRKPADQVISPGPFIFMSSSIWPLLYIKEPISTPPWRHHDYTTFRRLIYLSDVPWNLFSARLSTPHLISQIVSYHVKAWLLIDQPNSHLINLLTYLLRFYPLIHQ